MIHPSIAFDQVAVEWVRAVIDSLDERECSMAELRKLSIQMARRESEAMKPLLAALVDAITHDPTLTAEEHFEILKRLVSEPEYRNHAMDMLEEAVLAYMD